MELGLLQGAPAPLVVVVALVVEVLVALVVVVEALVVVVVLPPPMSPKPMQPLQWSHSLFEPPHWLFCQTPVLLLWVSAWRVDPLTTT